MSRYSPGCRLAALLAAGLVLAACEPALAPEARRSTTPAPVPSVPVDALRAMHADARVDSAQLVALQRVAAAMAVAGDAPRDAENPPALTPSMASALRKLPAADGGDEALIRTLRTIAAPGMEGEPWR